MTHPEEPTVAIHAQLLPGSAGGIETNLLCLLKALDRMGGSGRQVVIGPGGESTWLEAHLGPNQSILAWPPIRFTPVGRPRWLPLSVWELGKRVLGKRRFHLAQGLAQLRRQLSPAMIEEGDRITRVLIDRGVHLVHFPYQRHFPTTLPTIFEPWDLQHRHHPEFFSARDLELREQIYQTGCDAATLIVTASEWTKRDLVRQFGVSPERVAVIRRGVAASGGPRLPRDEAARRLRSLGLPERFILYPAKTWPHKNHARLFQALAHLRDRQRLTVPLVCTGKPVAEHWPLIQRRIEQLSLGPTVIFTGHLDDQGMAALLRAAEFLIFPSLFEGLGIPLLEAMRVGLPIVTSNVTCLPEVAGDGALYFDPLSVEAIADAIQRAWSQPDLLKECRDKATARLPLFDWDVAVRQFRACYRSVAKVGLEDEDVRLLREITRRGTDIAAPAERP